MYFESDMHYGWATTRYRIASLVLRAENLIPDENSDSEDGVEAAPVNIDEKLLLLEPTKQQFVAEVREIGIDGILICLLLQELYPQQLTAIDTQLPHFVIQSTKRSCT